MSVDNTLAERGNRYGDFTDHAKIAQDLQDVMRRGVKMVDGGSIGVNPVPGWNALSPVQKQALTVIADKIARVLSGDPNYADNWHDMQGYAKLVEDRLPREATFAEAVGKFVEAMGTVQLGSASVEACEQLAVPKFCPECGIEKKGDANLHWNFCPLTTAPASFEEEAEAAFAEAVGPTEENPVPLPADWRPGDRIVALVTNEHVEAGSIYTLHTRDPQTYEVWITCDKHYKWPDGGIYVGPVDLFKWHLRNTHPETIHGKAKRPPAPEISLPVTASDDFDEARVDRVASSHGDGEHYDVVPPCLEWLAGDVVTAVNGIGSEFTVGNQYVLRADVEEGHVRVVADDKGRPNGWSMVNFTWHSRP